MEIPAFHLYISSARDLGKEREALATAVAAVPVDLPWIINYSPSGNDPLETAQVTDADLHVVLMGADITAPIGLEYSLAISRGRRPILLIKRGVSRSPAALDYVRTIGDQNSWQPFSSLIELQAIFLHSLTTKLVEMTPTLHLTEFEVQNLLAWAKRMTERDEVGEGEIDRGAGESSIILSVQRYYPSEGVLLEDDEDLPE